MYCHLLRSPALHASAIWRILRLYFCFIAPHLHFLFFFSPKILADSQTLCINVFLHLQWDTASAMYFYTNFDADQCLLFKYFPYLSLLSIYNQSFNHSHIAVQTEKNIHFSNFISGIIVKPLVMEKKKNNLHVVVIFFISLHPSLILLVSANVFCILCEVSGPKCSNSTAPLSLTHATVSCSHPPTTNPYTSHKHFVSPVEVVKDGGV